MLGSLTAALRLFLGTIELLVGRIFSTRTTPSNIIFTELNDEADAL
jgi:hypothetical protein